MCALISDLCGTDDRLPSRVASPNHHLLGNEDFLRRDLDPQVASGNHHAIALSQDLLKTDRQIRGRSECLGSRRESWKKSTKGGIRKILHVIKKLGLQMQNFRSSKDIEDSVKL